MSISYRDASVLVARMPRHPPATDCAGGSTCKCPRTSKEVRAAFIEVGITPEAYDEEVAKREAFRAAVASRKKQETARLVAKREAAELTEAKRRLAEELAEAKRRLAEEAKEKRILALMEELRNKI